MDIQRLDREAVSLGRDLESTKEIFAGQIARLDRETETLGEGLASVKELLIGLKEQMISLRQAVDDDRMESRKVYNILKGDEAGKSSLSTAIAMMELRLKTLEDSTDKARARWWQLAAMLLTGSMGTFFISQFLK